MDYDVLVIGSGIGGMESSLKLADMGYKVALVEKEASIGGRMILLSKVFPTLDCASCISGPKMSSTINHPNITTMTYTEVAGIARRRGGSFTATLRHKPRFVNVDTCTGCQDCERACVVAVPDQFNADLAPRRAAYIPFPQAVPKKAVLERAGTSPCIAACPAGIKAHGYVALARAGKHEEAFQLNLDATPLVGTLGRACYAPCENGCTRGQLEATIPIRMIKRYAADQHYAHQAGATAVLAAADAREAEPAPGVPGIVVEPSNGKAVAVVGSGPAGVTAAWQLARRGYRVTVFEAAPEPGGQARYGIPAYRLPKDVVAADLAHLLAIGVEIVCNHPVRDLAALKNEGYDAVVLATGTQKSARLDIPGEDAPGVLPAIELLRATAAGEAMNLTGRRVVVVGGDNVAMDAARTARRLGAADVTVVFGKERKNLSCEPFEADQAEAEGVTFAFGLTPTQVATGADGAVRVLAALPTAAVDDPVAANATVRELPADLVLVAAGLEVDPTVFAGLAATAAKSRIKVDRKSAQTKTPWLFAAGDVASGASSMVRAVGSGRRAAHMVDRWLTGAPLTGFTAADDRLSTVKHAAILGRQTAFTWHDPVAGRFDLSARPTGFAEVEVPFTEAEAVTGAAACLDCGVCSECNECVVACPVPDCIDFTDRERTEQIEVGAVVVSTGHKLFAANLKPEYGFGRFPNVITGMQMDRLLAPTRPFNTVLRPSDGKVPDRIAYVSCTGSRDKQVGNPSCSKFCCMYSIKQNQLIMGALPLADVTMHYMDMRASGKRYDEFYTQAKDMGAQYIKGRVADIKETHAGDLVLRYEDIENGGGIVEAEYDLVVLAVGIQPNRDIEAMFTDAPLGLDEYYYVAEPSEEIDPGATDIPGVFVAGTAAGAKDIVDVILHSGAAVAGVAAHLEHHHFTSDVPARQEVSA